MTELRTHLVSLSLFPSYFDGTAAAEVMGLEYDDAEDSLGELLELNIVRPTFSLPHPSIHSSSHFSRSSLNKRLPCTR